MRSTHLISGSPAPWFKCRTQTSDRYSFDTTAGRYVVLYFFGFACDPLSSKVLKEILSKRERFNDIDLFFFGVSVDAEDERQERVSDSIPGIRYFWDFDRSVSDLYGAAHPDGAFHPVIYVLDPALRVLAVLPCTPTPERCAASLFALLNKLLVLGAPYPALPQAPVLVLPRVFEPELCQALLDYYTAHGGQESGFMDDIKGKTALVTDYRHKRRRDCIIEDAILQKACLTRIRDRLVPEVHKAFQFLATRVERQIAACYDATEEGYFKPHRDNTTKGTAHRRFAVPLFLNSGDYDGGSLRFPEFGRGLYAAPQGGAVVFSCSLLHEAMPVTRGRRYMYLPFLYDEAGSRIRETNLQYMDTDAKSGRNEKALSA